MHSYLKPGLALAIVFSLHAPFSLAEPGDSCQKKSDCDRGERCRANICIAANGDSRSRPTMESEGASDDESATEPNDNCGLPPGYTLTCRLYSGRVVNACGIPGAVPARIGDPCHIGQQPGVSIRQR